MSAEDEYEAGEDQIAEKLADLDDNLADQRAATLRASLSDYDLDDEDADLLEGVEQGDDGMAPLLGIPLLLHDRST